MMYKTVTQDLITASGYDAGFAELYSLPFGNVAPSGVKLFIGTIDGVNGFFFGKLFNPTATMIGGCLHPFDCYLRKTQKSTNNGE